MNWMGAAVRRSLAGSAAQVRYVLLITLLLGAFGVRHATLNAAPTTVPFYVQEFAVSDLHPAQLSDGLVRSALQSVAARGTSATPGPTVVATNTGGGASLDNLSASDAMRIQNAANKIGIPITVVGSRAGGTAGAWSDWDYVITGANSATKGKVRNSLPEGHRGVGAPRNIDIFTGAVNTDLPHITFNPC